MWQSFIKTKKKKNLFLKNIVSKPNCEKVIWMVTQLELASIYHLRFIVKSSSIIIWNILCSPQFYNIFITNLK